MGRARSSALGGDWSRHTHSAAARWSLNAPASTCNPSHLHAERHDAEVVRLAALWRARVAAAGHERAQRQIARTARSWLRRSAAGSPNSAHRLACEYERPSNGARPQPKLAVLATKRAATWRHPSAMHALGWHYANGFGVRESSRLAIYWYTESANQRSATSDTESSMHNLWLLLSQRTDAASQRRAPRVARACGRRRLTSGFGSESVSCGRPKVPFIR